ncbi:hypothetical protein TorRG33x02_052410 [Trema orientale]|uniref:Uncharacterized protein n=1 Tax=Trema orientale TaxID=63057 RepID=A0A2P5FMJ7_TREOI|nr:hypothetical protein TorRG33x02_052410 [Trema orientale]
MVKKGQLALINKIMMETTVIWHILNNYVYRIPQMCLDLDQSGIGKHQDFDHKILCVSRIAHFHHPDEEQVDAKTRLDHCESVF